MTARQITDAIDTTLAAFLPTMAGAQAAYLAAHGEYWQGLPTHSVVPADGAAVAPDEATSLPSGESESWAQIGTLPATMTACLRIDQYLGPDGAGYVLVAQVMIASLLWQRSIQCGPEAWREQAWSRAGSPGAL